MVRIVFIALVCVLLFVGDVFAQEVFIARDASAGPSVTVATEKEKPAPPLPKAQIVKAEPQIPKAEPVKKADPVKEQVAKVQPVKAPPVKEPASESIAKPQPPKAPATKVQPAVVDNMKTQPLKVALVKAQPMVQPSQSFAGRTETAFTKLADGFDFPIGKPDAQGYYKARGFRGHGHLGEDWDGVGGGDTDLGDPIYSIGDGIVVFARDCHMGWGNVIIVRHTYREGGEVKNIDALYGHLNSILVKRGQAISRGQQVGTMGTAHGLYDAHLHLEIRKNLEIGMSRAKFARDFSNYYDPTQFIQSHRHLQTSESKYKVALNTFTYDSKINWAKAKNYSGYRGGGGSESAVALKKAVAAQNR